MLGIFYHNKKVKSKKKINEDNKKQHCVLYTRTHTNKRTHIQPARRVRT